MAKIHKLTKGGQTIYPATTTDAVVHPTTHKNLTKELTNIELEQKLYKKAIFGTNLFNKDAEFTDGKYINYMIAGKEIVYSENPNYAVSEYIPIVPNERYIGNAHEGGAYSVFFDEDLKPISLFKSNEAPLSPMGAAWAKLSFIKSEANKIMFIKGENLSQYEPYYDSFDVEEVRRNNNIRISPALWNLEKGKVIDKNGIEVNSDDIYKISEFIKFDREKGLLFKLQSSTNVYISCLALYDNNKLFVKGYSSIDNDGTDEYGGTPKEHIIYPTEIPTSVKYFRVVLTTEVYSIGHKNYKISYKDFENYIVYKELISKTDIEDDINIIKNKNEIIQENKVLKFYNCFNPNDENYKEDCFINGNGKEITNQYSSIYAVTGYIKVPNFFECISINYEVGNVYAAFYDKDKKFISASEYLYKGNRKIDYVENAYYVRFTIIAGRRYNTIISFEEIATNTAYVPYGEVYKLDNQTDIYIKKRIKENIGSTTNRYDNVHAEQLTNGEMLEITDIPDNKNYYGIGVSFNIISMGTVKIYKSQNNYNRGEIDIDDTNITEYKDNGIINVIPHGLNISNGLIVCITKITDKAEIALTNTSGESVTLELPNWNGCQGNKIIFVAISGTYNNIVLSHSGTWMDKNTWVFGDSYTDIWPKQCYGNGAKNFYLDGYPGRASLAAYNSLLYALRYGKPKRILWMLGMNDADTDNAVNESWNQVFNQLRNLCDTIDIKLILCTIPNVPDRIHTFKNSLIRKSGLPYIDMASALGANDINSTWYHGLISSDNVHPSTDGAKLIANCIISGISDIKM